MIYWTDYVPFYGVVSSNSRVISQYDDGEISFAEAAATSVVSGAITGSIFGLSVSMMPTVGIVSLLASGVLLPTAMLATPFVAGFAANEIVISSAPEEEQRGLWQMFSSALSGNSFGGDYSGLV